MSTVNNLEIIKEMIKNEGRYEDDPPVVRITAYMNAFSGEVCYGLDYHLPTAYCSSEFVRFPLVVFQQDDTMEQATKVANALAAGIEEINSSNVINGLDDANVRLLRHMTEACKLRLSRWVE